MESRKYLTVTALNKYIAKKFEVDPYLVEIYLKGEISNFKIHNSNNIYFSIKDENTRINAVCFGAKDTNFKDGDTVYIKAKINFYLPRGEHNLLVLEMKKDRVGELYQKFLQLKEKLEKEGLFDLSNKKQIPKISNNIAVVTAKTGAAVQDIKRTIYRRYPLANVRIYSTLVQGDASIKDIVKNLIIADTDNNDIIILARGGGSIEDLWSFNSEEVVRTIFSCNTPIVTGIGHETDTTLADYVSDKRASTPTAAAELVTPNIEDIKNYIKFITNKLNNLIDNKIQQNKINIERNANSYAIKNYNMLYENYKEKISSLKLAMEKKISVDVAIKIMKTANLTEKFQKIDILANIKNDYMQKVHKLEANSPLNILKKGYAITLKENEKITTVDQVAVDDKINVTLSDGSLTCKVIDVSKERD